MVKLSYFLPQASDPVAMKKQLVECGVLDLTNELIYKMAPEAVDPAILSRGSLTIRQYTRSALKLLRDDILSNNRPFCMSDPKLRTIDIWKSNHSYKHQESYSMGNDRSISSYGSPFENRHSNFRQYPPYRSRSFNDGGRNFSSSNHLMPPFMVRRQKLNVDDKESESFEMKNEQIERDKSTDKTDSIEPELKENNGLDFNQTKKELTAPESFEKQVANQNNPFLYQHDGDDECSTDGKNIDRKNQSTTISSKSIADVATEMPQISQLNREERRIGSGRISLGKEWEYFNKDNDKSVVARNPQFASEELQMPRQDEEKNISTHRFHNNRHRRRRYDSYSSKSNTSNDEPEWFSAGPTSRLEVIELHGFDDDCSSTGSDSKNAVASTNAEKSKIKKDDEIASVTTSQSSPPPARSTPTKYGYKKYENRGQSSNNRNQNDSNKNEFMFDTFFNPFANSSGDDKKAHRIEPKNGPRYNNTPWFDSNITDNNLHQNLNPQVPPNHKSFYDNWTNNTSVGKNTACQPDTFNNNNIRAQLPYRVASVEELEAKMFHTGKTNQENLMQMLSNMNNKQYQNQQYQDKEKFKYLINQMSSVNFANKSVNFYQEQQTKQFYLLKHQQQQDILRVAEILQKYAAYSLTAIPIHQMNRGDILNRPEAQALLQAIARNEISINSLIQIVNNNAMPHITRNSIFEYNREIILTVLNFIQLQKQHQQQQQAAIQINSQLNLMNNFLPISQNLPQRVPSTQELQFHTESILQSALLRKKIEEQKKQKTSVNESFGDFMVNSSLNTAGNVSSSIHPNNHNKILQQSKLFTPTSVLKNINADNKNDSVWPKLKTPAKLISDNGEIQNKFDFNTQVSQSDNFEQPQKHIQWTKPELYKPNNSKPIVGRSILKKSTYQSAAPTNESIQSLQVENSVEFETNQQQQQLESSTILPSTDVSPTKNQLSKWFTPELLAQASAGKLPSLNRSEVVFLEEFEKNAHQS